MKETLDCEVCIKILLNKQSLPVDRIAAAESLMFCDGNPEANNALFKVLRDSNEDHFLREECAGSLGSIFTQTEIDYEMLLETPENFLRELVSDFRLAGIPILGSRLGQKVNQIKCLIGDLVDIT